MEEATMSAAEPRTVDTARGTGWWTDGWALFTKSAGMWIVFSLILLIIYLVLAAIPLLGSLAGSLLAPVFVGGWLIAARKLESGGTLELNDLFAGFKDKLTPLLVLGALVLAAMLLISVVAGVLGLGAYAGMGLGTGYSGAGGIMAAAGAGMLALLVGLVLGFVVSMAVWFAPALVVFRNVPPIDALKASVAATLKNIVPFLIYGLVFIVASIVASIPFGLGWLVLLPVLMLTIYVSYKDVFAA